MDRIQFTINSKKYSVGSDVESEMTLVEFIRRRANLLGTKFMCREAGCGACIVSVIKPPETSPVAINACMVTILSCHNWQITTIEKVGNKLDGYHPIQKTLAKYNGSQCGHCSPGWVMSFYSLLESKKDLSMIEIEKSLSSNVCRCTGYRPILDAFKSFAKDAPKSEDINDIEDLHGCKKCTSCDKSNCEKTQNEDDWYVVTNSDVEAVDVTRIILKDGRYWYRVQTIKEIFDILEKINFISYMLVCGNTAKGAYPTNEYPTSIIDISKVEELKGYKVDQNLVINSGTTLTELINICEELSERDNNFKYLKKLQEHLGLVASTTVRNLGSIGGNLMIKHYHNEFPSDIYLLLTTVGAQVTLLWRPNVQQVVTMEQFLKTNMTGKIILNVLLPPLNDDFKLVTYKIMPKAQNAHAIVNAGFLYKYKNINGRVVQCRIAYGGLSPSFTRALRAEKLLVGKMLFTNETLQSTLRTLESELVVEDNPPAPSATYRKQLALALFYKSLLFLSPPENVKPKFRSGAIKLNISRPLSRAQQKFDTNPSLYPLNEPIPRLDSLMHCSGEATYTDDRPIRPGELFAALVLSTVPTGRIVSIDPSRALKVPGAVAFYSAKDIPGLNSFTQVEDAFGGESEEVFSSGDIKYYNQPIGVVAAVSIYVAEKIAKMVDVKYSNVRKPVISIKEAMKDPKRNSLFEQINATDRGNDIYKTIKGGLAGLGQIHMTMETIAIVSRPTEEGLEVFASTQQITAVQLMISRALNIQQNKVDVYVRRIGGGFGLKVSRPTLSAVACSLVSIKLNTPCRIIMPLTHVTQALGKRMPFASEYELAVDERATIQYLNLNLYEDNGFMFNEKLQKLAVIDYNNCYDEKRWNYKNISTFTDTAKNTWFRSPGHLENMACVEEIMERISYELSFDPIDVRLANIDQSVSSDILEIVNTLKSSSDYTKRKDEVKKFNDENRWKKRGLGVALMQWKKKEPRNFDVIVSVYYGDASIIITHGGTEMGQGINTTITQICAYLLKVPVDKIQVKTNSTIVSPNANVTGGSITTQYITMGVRKCCLELLERLSPVRAQMNNPTWEELIKKAFEMDVDLQVQGYVGIKEEISYNLFGMAIAEAEVDILTGEKEIKRVDILEDTGLSANPNITLGQIEGAFVQGMGYWLTENLVYDQATGKLLTDRTWNYYVPQALDIPQDFRVSFRSNPTTSEKIFGAKCVSEPPICMSKCVTHAIRQAISSARVDCQISSTTWFDIDGTYTLEKVCLAAETKLTDYKLC